MLYPIRKKERKNEKKIAECEISVCSVQQFQSHAIIEFYRVNIALEILSTPTQHNPNYTKTITIRSGIL